MKKKVDIINKIDSDNKGAYLEFFFKLLQEIEKELFIESHYTSIDDFGINFNRELTQLKIYVFSKKMTNKGYMMSVPEHNAMFAISYYNNDFIRFEVAFDSPRSDLKEHYISLSKNSKINDYDYKILFTHHKDKNIIKLCEHYISLNNSDILDIKQIKIKIKEEKLIVDVLYIIEEEFIWLSETIKELNLDENLLVFDREEFLKGRREYLSDLLDDKSLFLIEAKYI